MKVYLSNELLSKFAPSQKIKENYKKGNNKYQIIKYFTSTYEKCIIVWIRYQSKIKT